MIRLGDPGQPSLSAPNLVDELIRSHLKEHRISRTELVQRMGYSKIAKGLRRLDQIRSGDMKIARQMQERLADGLNLEAEQIDQAIAETERAIATARDAEYRKTFRPHAIILTSNRIPSPIFPVSLYRLDRLLRIEFEEGSSPVTYARQAQRQLPEGIPCFGRVTGFMVYYSPDQVVAFDTTGNPTGDGAIRIDRQPGEKK